METNLELYKDWYGTFLLNKFDLVQSAIIKGGWEPHVQNVYHKFLTKESIAVDVGAHVGFHTKRMADYAKKVYAFEPQKFLYNQLCANVILNNYNNKIDCINIALGEIQKTTSFNPDNHEITPQNYNLGGKSLDDSLGDNNIRVSTLDSFSLNPDFIKVDVEGYELKFLQGAIQTILKHQPIIAIETFTKSFNLINSFFESINYSLILIPSTEAKHDYVAFPLSKFSPFLLKNIL